jgi:hypothetical protein
VVEAALELNVAPRGPAPTPPTAEQINTQPPADKYKHTLDQDWAISILMELQKSSGTYEAKITSLSADMTETRRIVSRLEKWIFAAIVVITISATVLGWLINAAKDVFLTTYKAQTDQHISAPQTPAVENPAKRSQAGQR